MSKYACPDVLDAGFILIRDKATHLVAVSGQPTSFVDAEARALAWVEVYESHFQILDGTMSGRRLKVGARSNVVVRHDGYADHVALIDKADGRLLYVTTCPSRRVIKGGMISIASWDIEIGAPG